MSWSDRPAPPRRAVLAGLGGGLLAGCGFAPVYAPGRGGAALAGNVAIQRAPGTNGFTLTEALQDRLGAPGPSPRYRLAPTVRVSSERVAVTTAQSTNRFNLVGTAGYTLADTASGAQIAAGQVDGFNSYSATGTSVATSAARQDATDRLMVILADKLVAELLALPGLSP